MWLQYNLQEAVGEISPLYSGQEKWGLAVTVCDRDNMTVQGKFSQQEEHMIPLVAEIICTLAPGWP